MKYSAGKQNENESLPQPSQPNFYKFIERKLRRIEKEDEELLFGYE